MFSSGQSDLRTAGANTRHRRTTDEIDSEA
jgi:hypothetical protein